MAALVSMTMIPSPRGLPDSMAQSIFTASRGLSCTADAPRCAAPMTPPAFSPAVFASAAEAAPHCAAPSAGPPLPLFSVIGAELCHGAAADGSLTTAAKCITSSEAAATTAPCAPPTADGPGLLSFGEEPAITHGSCPKTGGMAVSAATALAPTPPKQDPVAVPGAVVLALDDLSRYNTLSPAAQESINAMRTVAGALRSFAPRDGRPMDADVCADARGTTTVFHSASIPPMPLLSYVARLARASFSDDNVMSAAVVLALRWQRATQIPITTIVVHRLMAACTIVAAKSHSDCFPANDAFAKASGISADELFGLEMTLLADLQFSAVVSWHEVAALQHLAVENKRTRAVWADNGPLPADVVRGSRINLCAATVINDGGSFSEPSP